MSAFALYVHCTKTAKVQEGFRISIPFNEDLIAMVIDGNVYHVELKTTIVPKLSHYVELPPALRNEKISDILIITANKFGNMFGKPLGPEDLDPEIRVIEGNEVDEDYDVFAKIDSFNRKIVSERIKEFFVGKKAA